MKRCECGIQLAIDELRPCPACEGTGAKVNRETDDVDRCRVCDGTGQVAYDPDDDAIPY